MISSTIYTTTTLDTITNVAFVKDLKVIVINIILISFIAKVPITVDLSDDKLCL